MLLLLKMKRTKSIIPLTVQQEDNTVQQYYNVGHLMEIVCRLPPFKDVLADLAGKASISKEEILMNMRALFQSESLGSIARGNSAVVSGVGRLPLKYQDALLGLRNEVFRRIGESLGKVEWLTGSTTGAERSLSGALKGMLGLCAIWDPQMEVEDPLACVLSQETLELYTGPRTSLQIDARKVSHTARRRTS